MRTTRTTARSALLAVTILQAAAAAVWAGGEGPPGRRSGPEVRRMARPPGNTGKGFFVVGDRLYDANGLEFLIEGVNKIHPDFGSPGIGNSGANTVRAGMGTDWNINPVIRSTFRDIIAGKMVLIPGFWDGTCKSEPALLDRMVDQWIADAAYFGGIERQSILNIANEWGPDHTSPVWRDEYVKAIARLRGAGITSTLMVDAGACGQDPLTLTKYARAVLESDPQRNVIFDLHIYGAFADGGRRDPWQRELGETLDGLARLGVVVVLGEFGPGRNIGPSPTRVRPGAVIRKARARHFGWLAWAWDDNNLADARADDHWFSMTYSPGTGYTTSKSAELTLFGREVVENPRYGLRAVARKATVFP